MVQDQESFIRFVCFTVTRDKAKKETGAYILRNKSTGKYRWYSIVEHNSTRWFDDIDTTIENFKRYLEHKGYTAITENKSGKDAQAVSQVMVRRRTK